MTNGNGVTTEMLQAQPSLDGFYEGWEKRKKVAEMLIRSGFLPKSYKTPEQVLAVMLTAYELGIPEMEALRSINVIAGQPTVSPGLKLAMIYRSQLLEDLQINDDGKKCTVMMKRKGIPSPCTVSFSMEDADRMLTSEWQGDVKRVIKLSEKSNWKQMPQTMRQWRAIDRAARILFADIVRRLYSADELGAVVEMDEGGWERVVEAPQKADAPVPVASSETLDQILPPEQKVEPTGSLEPEQAPAPPPPDEPGDAAEEPPAPVEPKVETSGPDKAVVLADIISEIRKVVPKFGLPDAKLSQQAGRFTEQLLLRAFKTSDWDKVRDLAVPDLVGGMDCLRADVKVTLEQINKKKGAK